MTPDGDQDPRIGLPAASRRAVEELRRLEPPPDLIRAAMAEVAATSQRTRWSLPGPVLLAAGAAVAIAVAVALPQLLPRLGQGVAPSGLPLGATVELRVKVPDGAHPGSADAGSVWLGHDATGRIIRIDAATGASLGEVQITDPTQEPFALWPVSDGASVWVAGWDDRSLARVDVASMEVTARWPIDAVPYRILPAGDTVWISDFEDGRVIALDAAGGGSVGAVSILRPTGMALDGSTLWVVDYVGNLYEVDVATLTVVRRLDVAGRATDLLMIDGDLLIWGIYDRPLERVDTRSGAVTASRAGVTAAATLNGDLWAAMQGGSVVRLHPVSLAPLAGVSLGDVTTDQLVASSDRLWAYTQGAEGTRVDAVRPRP